MSRWYNIRLRCGCLISDATQDNPGGGGLISCEKDVCLSDIYFVHKRYEPLVRLLQRILSDGTGSVMEPNKRVWPIRAASYREGRQLLKNLRESLFEILD